MSTGTGASKTSCAVLQTRTSMARTPNATRSRAPSRRRRRSLGELPATRSESAASSLERVEFRVEPGHAGNHSATLLASGDVRVVLVTFDLQLTIQLRHRGQLNRDAFLIARRCHNRSPPNRASSLRRALKSRLMTVPLRNLDPGTQFLIGPAIQMLEDDELPNRPNPAAPVRRGGQSPVPPTDRRPPGAPEAARSRVSCRDGCAV